MGGYLAFAWRRQDAAAAAHAKAVTRRLTARQAWRLADDIDGFRILVETRHALQVRRLSTGGGRVIGDLFERAAYRPAADLVPAPGEISAQGAHLVSAYWGRYAAIWPVEGDLAALRDPTGTLEVLRWRAGGLTLVASGLPADGLGELAPVLSLDWPAIARLLAMPDAPSAELALSGLEAAAPGVLLQAGAEEARTVWSPISFARGKALGPPHAAEALEAVVDGCVGAYVRSGAHLLGEVSGGLDSAIVAAALLRASPAPVRAWTHLHTLDVEGDERRYAQAVAEHFGLELTVVPKPEQAFTSEGLAALPTGLRPSVNGLDAQYDESMARLCVDLEVDAILTGQGGDAVFFQTPTALAAADLWGRGLGLAGWVEALTGIARWTRQSAWSVARTAVLGAVGLAHAPRTAPAAFVSAKARRLAGRPRPHPWLADLHGIAPAKRLQIEGLIYGQAYLGASRRGREADLIHPLLSQPIVELGLAIPIADLTQGGRGRALARTAFRARLPRLVVERRSKGDVTAYYGRMLGRSLAALRPYLLDGRLAGEGLLDLPVLDAMLSEEHLIWRGDYGDLLQLIGLEAWVRHWQDWLGGGRPS